MQDSSSEQFSVQMQGDDNSLAQSLISASEAPLTHQSIVEGSQSTLTLMDGEQDHRNKLTTLNGCYVPCLLNIMGIILFLRLGWAIGEAGIMGVLGIFAISEFSSILTVLSLSAIVSNGTMRGGGCYYMISRTLGPEFGGSIGILFYLAYAVGATFYVTGFAEEVRNTFFPDEGAWFIAGIASAVLLVTFIIALNGAEAFTKINVALFLLQFSAILMAMFAMFFRPGPVDLKSNDTTFEGFSFTNVGKVWESGYTNDAEKCGGSGDCGFAIIFAVVMPATTGIMEGANLSGDLKNPSYSIPVGTIAAVGTSIVFYLLLVMGYGGSFSRETLLASDIVMQESSWWPPLVITGILVSSASSALGALFGGSRILQALARDKVFPGLDVFSQGTAKGDEPTYALIFTWLITQSCCVIFRGSLDGVANFISALFCLSYASVNLCAFLLEVSGTPNFRPAWQYYSWHTCLLGMLINFGIMFYLNWAFGLVAILVEVFIFLLLVYRAPKMAWGEVTQSVIFHQVRKYLLQLDERKMHSKHWRPSVLLLVSDTDLGLIDFCNQLKKGGLYIIGHTLVGDFQSIAEHSHKFRNQWINWIEEHGYKAFPQVSIGPDLRTCYQNLMLLAGLGAMSPNTVVLPIWKKAEPDQPPAINRRHSILQTMQTVDGALIADKVTHGDHVTPLGWLECLQDILTMHKNIVVTENFHNFDIQLIGSNKLREIYKRSRDTRKRDSRYCLDVVIEAGDYTWPIMIDEEKTGDTEYPMLLLQLSHIITLNKKWQRIVEMRILLMVELEWSQEKKDRIRTRLETFLALARITEYNLQIHTAPITKRHKDLVGYYTELNELIFRENKQTLFTFLKLPDLPDFEDLAENGYDDKDAIAEEYVRALEALTMNLSPTALVQTGELINAIATAI